MTAASVQLKQRVVDTLNSRACQGIRFVAGKMYLMPFKDRDIADSIDRGGVAIQVGGLPAGYDAKYRDRARGGPALALGDDGVGAGSDVEGLATIVHEATHAAIDASIAGRSIESMENEFAGYLARRVFTRAAARAGDAAARRLDRENPDASLSRLMSPLVDQVLAANDRLYVIPAEYLANGMTFLTSLYQARPEDETMKGLVAPVRPAMVQD